VAHAPGYNRGAGSSRGHDRPCANWFLIIAATIWISVPSELSMAMGSVFSMAGVEWLGCPLAYSSSFAAAYCSRLPRPACGQARSC